jgi:anti-anti-sigma factor
MAFSSDAEQTHVLVDFVRSGRERDERVVYFSHRKAPREVAEQLRRRHIDADALIAQGRLVIESASAASLKGGRFEAESVKAKWFSTIAQTIADGYQVMRVAGDMSWAADGLPGSDDLASYEKSIADVFATGHVIGLCEFDRRLFSGEALEHFAALHPQEVHVHAVYEKDSLYVRLISDPPGASIAGEVDVHNRDELTEALETLMETLDGDVHLDVSGLRFIDARGLATLVRSTRQLKRNSRMVLYGMRPHIYKALQICGWTNIPNLVIEMLPR